MSLYYRVGGIEKDGADYLAKRKIFAIDLKFLKKLDLTGINFERVDIRKKDFTGTKGVTIKPRLVYKKSLYYTTLTDVEIEGSFYECDVVGANFKGSRGVKIDPQVVSYGNLTNTVLIDVEITGSFENCITKGTVFKEEIDEPNQEIDFLIKNINIAFNYPIDSEPNRRKRSPKKNYTLKQKTTEILYK